MPTTRDVEDWDGRRMVGPDDEKLGKIDGVYVDDATGEPAWALVHTGLLGRRSTFVPIAEARRRGDDVVVPYGKAAIADAPGIDPDEHVTPEQEAELRRFYDRTGGPAGAGTAAPAGPGPFGDAPPTAAPTTGTPARPAPSEDGMVLSEERIEVSTRELPPTKVRMRKHVVTEEVTITVPVTREEVRLEEVPADAPDLSPSERPSVDDSGAVVLHSEVPVVQTRSVETERVRLDKETVVDQVPVTEPVRRERLDVERTDLET